MSVVRINAQDLPTLTAMDTNVNSQSMLCFHCHESIPSGTRIYVNLKNRNEPVCCEGCRAVAELIATMGLADYYQYRTEPALKPSAPSDTLGNDEWQVYAQTSVAQLYTRDESNDRHSAVILLDGLRCAACAWLVDRRLRREPGVREVSVNVATGRARIVWSPKQIDFATLLRTLAQLGYRPHPIDAHSIQVQARDERREILKRLGVSGLGMMQVMMYVLPFYAHSTMDSAVKHYLQLTSLLITTPVLFYAGWPFLANAVRTLRLRSTSMDVPVALALLLAYSASTYNTLTQHGEVYFDSVNMFIFLLTLGRCVEMWVRHRSNSITDALARMQPRIAHRITPQGITDVALPELVVNDEILVRAGEAVPADGIISSGCSTLDEALLSGESMPVARTQNQRVLAGTINVEAPLQVRITAVGQATVMSGVLALLERAQATKPHIALAADRTAQWFLHAMLIVTVLVAITWWIVDPSRVLYAVLAVLVVTCPCALSLATPAVIAATTTALARRGLLITHADTIEQLAKVDLMVFDKTGTLTSGDLAVISTKVIGSLSVSECRAIAAALEQAADHPIARAFIKASSEPPSATELAITPGAGVTGVVAGVRYRLGTAAFVSALRVDALSTPEDAAEIWLGTATATLARFELQDAIRSDAVATLKQLNELRVRSALLSGDATSAVARVATTCGIADYHSRLTPAAKLNALQKYKCDAHTAMVGDGINDAPVFGAASVSIAMGAGAALAHATADAVLINNALLVLPQAIVLARKARRIMNQNLWWAAVYNLSAVPLAALGWVPPWLAAAGMSLSSVLVVLNATRMLHSDPAPTSRNIAPTAFNALPVGSS